MKPVFNSLGSNYSLKFARQNLLTSNWRNKQAPKELIQLLNERYQGESRLYYRGRVALSEAVRLTKAEYVLVNSLTCFAVEEAVRLAGSQIIFADIDEDGYHYSLKQLLEAHQQQPKLGAIIIQSTFGFPIEIKAIKSYCDKHNIMIIEDLAHCLERSYKEDIPMGTVGDLVMMSFGRGKQIDIVSGGALVVRKQSLKSAGFESRQIRGRYWLRFAERFLPLTTRLVRLSYHLNMTFGKLHHGLTTLLKLTPRTVAGPALLSVSLPAWRARLVLNKIKDMPAEVDYQRQLIQVYDRSGLPIINQPDYPQDLSSGLTVRYPLLVDAQIRDLLVKKLQRRGFELTDIWYDTPISPKRMIPQSQYKFGSCPQTERICDRIINLPFHRSISLKQAGRLTEIVKKYGRFQVSLKPNKREWNRALRQLTKRGVSSHLLASFEHIQINKLLRNQVFYGCLYRKGEVVCLFSAVVIKAKRARFLELRGNPLFATDSQSQWLAFELIRQFASENNCDFIRLQPTMANDETNRQILAELGCKPSPSILNAPDTILLDLSLLEDEILSQMRRQTRYRIRQSRQLVVRQDNSFEGLKAFLKLLRETSQRQKFTSVKFYQIVAEYKVYLKAGKLNLYLAYDQAGEKLCAGAFMIEHNQELTYFYGASNRLGRSLSGAYAIQLQAIKDAQAKGLKRYNLFGVAPAGYAQSHRLAGLTHFKEGLGGRRVNYLDAHDYVLKPFKYSLTYSFEKLRKWHRRS